MTRAPAEFFGETDRGRIAPGYVADLAVVPPTHLTKARMTIKAGEIVYRERA
jgi:predicted amidohydrolase YtcJ